MNRNTKIAVGIVIILVVALAGYFLASSAKDSQTMISTSTQNKVAAIPDQDGEYYVVIQDVQSNPEDTVLVSRHVTYFEGEEAKASAKDEVKCPASQTTEECVPTLAKGYYVRSGAPTDWSIPVTKDVQITMSGKIKPTLETLSAYVKAAPMQPVFVITLKDGQVTKIAEKTHF